MVIYNLDIKYIPSLPNKTHAPLLVDADAELAGPVTLQRLQVVPRR
jgi:hypothetical protein